MALSAACGLPGTHALNLTPGKRAEHIRNILDQVFAHDTRGGINPLEGEFLIARLLESQPRCVAEIGTAAGVSTAIILKALDLLPHPKDFFAFEYLTYCYFAPEREPGYLVGLTYDELPSYYHPNWGIGSADMGKAMEGKGQIDFLLIDGNHSHPWATLDTICALPYLADNALLVYHDINLHLIGSERSKDEYGPHLLFYHFPGLEKITPGVSLPNIGAFRLDGSPQAALPHLLEVLYSHEWVPNSWPTLDLEAIKTPAEVIKKYLGVRQKAYLLEFMQAYLENRNTHMPTGA